MRNILVRICDALFCALLLRRAELVDRSVCMRTEPSPFRVADSPHLDWLRATLARPIPSDRLRWSDAWRCGYDTSAVALALRDDDGVELEQNVRGRQFHHEVLRGRLPLRVLFKPLVSTSPSLL